MKKFFHKKKNLHGRYKLIIFLLRAKSASYCYICVKKTKSASKTRTYKLGFVERKAHCSGGTYNVLGLDFAKLKKLLITFRPIIHKGVADLLLY